MLPNSEGPDFLDRLGVLVGVDSFDFFFPFVAGLEQLRASHSINKKKSRPICTKQHGNSRQNVSTELQAKRRVPREDRPVHSSTIHIAAKFHIKSSVSRPNKSKKTPLGIARHDVETVTSDGMFCGKLRLLLFDSPRQPKPGDIGRELLPTPLCIKLGGQRGARDNDGDSLILVKETLRRC